MNGTQAQDNLQEKISEVQICLNHILHTEALEDTFAGFIIESKTNNDFKVKGYENHIKKLIQGMDTPEKIRSMLREYIDGIANILNPKKVNLLLSLLEFAINGHLIQAKGVCEAILTSEYLDITNETFFCAAFELINKIISMVDYKGVRDLIRFMVEKVNSLPVNANVSILPQLDAMHKVMSYALNRNSNLLPAYLAVDEIQKKISDKSIHWRFADLLSSFIESFRPVAQMVSMIGRPKLLPVVGFSSTLSHSWPLDPTTARFQLQGLLPYKPDLLAPQSGFLRYVLKQPYSRDMIHCILALNRNQKSRCIILEEVIVDLIITAMEKSEEETDLDDQDCGTNSTIFLWQVIACHLIIFIIPQHISFSDMMNRINDILAKKNLRKGRNHLMWALLQFISSSICRNRLEDFVNVLKLQDILYPEEKPLPIPDLTKPSCAQILATSSTWVHFLKKVEQDPTKSLRPLPACLKHQVEFLQQLVTSKDSPQSLPNNLRTILICNAFSTNNEVFPTAMAALCDSIGLKGGKDKNISSNANSQMKPLPTSFLDSTTIHTKMSLLHSINSHITKSHPAKDSNQATPCPSTISCTTPAMLETYALLLVYQELELIGIKLFIHQTLSSVVRAQALGTLHVLLEMFVYRPHHTHASYKAQFLNHLHCLPGFPFSNIQFHLSLESFALKLIMGLTNTEVLQISQIKLREEPKMKTSNESEELNKVFILTLARTIHVTGYDSLIDGCKELLQTVMQSTPLTWSSFTLECFPSAVAEYYQQIGTTKENNSQLAQSVDEEHRKWITMNNDIDIINNFSVQNTPPLFLCLLWKMLLEDDRIDPIAFKILDRIGAKALSSHVRTLADYLVLEFSKVRGQGVNRYFEKLNDLIWKNHIITLDRLLLCLTLRAYEGNEAQVSLFIIQMLLITCNEFQNRVNDFVQEISPEYWKHLDWQEKHAAFHRKYPEKFYFEGLAEMGSQNVQHTYLPTYFSNICLRFIPILDLIVHRFLEYPPNNQTNLMDSLLEKYGCLYKFHDRPLTFLYETLHYYEQKLRDRPQLKRKLVATILGAFKDIKSSDWALSEAYLSYIPAENINWSPDSDYYFKLISRLVDTLNGKSAFPHVDWRFNEFTNSGAHALHVTCIELIALPVSPEVVANHLIDIILVGHKNIPRNLIENWLNTIGVVLTALPEPYWSVLNDHIIAMMQNPLLTTNPHPDPFQLMDFTGSHKCMTELQPAYLIALSHAFFHHASIGQMNPIPKFLRDRVRPIIKTEEQLLFIMHIVGPFFHRLGAERTRAVMNVTQELYSLLETVDKHCETLRYMDPICDLFYHLKYRIIGDQIKNEIEGKIRNLRSELQKRLRFITHLNIEAAT
ncbi:mediator complex subunit 23 [Brevipalpus obovatus]|uniref:mediator complex subunit 23 n=1 Tax=Brevipalpus obovatus TaxID=246614 RepID=UPI003D9E80A3